MRDTDDLMIFCKHIHFFRNHLRGASADSTVNLIENECLDCILICQYRFDCKHNSRKFTAGCDFTQRFYGFSRIGGNQELADQTEQAAAAYTDALRALSYHIYERENDVYDDTMVCHQKPSFSPSSIAYDPMITCIEHNDPDEIKRCCAQFVHSLFFTQLPPPDFIRGMCIHVLTNIRVRFLAKHTELSPEEPIRPDDVLLCHTITELIEWLTAGFLSLSESYKRQKKSSDPIIETAKEYIKNHISSNLKAKDVAATVNLSESYFTIYFKTKTGQNFRDYVLNARTDLAKKLLLEQRLSISEIAYATGYQDYRSFSRAFKNVTGISPSDYQNR